MLISTGAIVEIKCSILTGLALLRLNVQQMTLAAAVIKFQVGLWSMGAPVIACQDYQEVTAMIFKPAFLLKNRE
jgi:hypothetical protein